MLHSEAVGIRYMYSSVNVDEGGQISFNPLYYESFLSIASYRVYSVQLTSVRTLRHTSMNFIAFILIHPSSDWNKSGHGQLSLFLEL